MSFLWKSSAGIEKLINTIILLENIFSRIIHYLNCINNISSNFFIIYFLYLKPVLWRFPKWMTTTEKYHFFPVLVFLFLHGTILSFFSHPLSSTCICIQFWCFTRSCSVAPYNPLICTLS